MEEKIDFSKVPYQYAMCINRQCPKANTCLRQLVEQSSPEDIVYWTIISPKLLNSLKGDCPYYRPHTKVSYAQGFVEILETLPFKQMQVAVSHLMSHFGKRTYYRVRKGERLLSPAEQRQILNILKNNGITPTQDFDKFVEDYEW